jgi:hypothetical protein
VRMIEQCRFNAKIDAAQQMCGKELLFLSKDELHALTESIKVGIRCGAIDEIEGMLITVDPVLANLWIV